MQRLIDINRSKLDLKVRLNLYPRYPVNSSYYLSTWWLAQSLYFKRYRLLCIPPTFTDDRLGHICQYQIPEFVNIFPTTCHDCA